MHRLSLIGFGEAARTFVADGLGAVAAYDVDPAKRDGLAAHSALGDVLDGSTAVLSLVTADQALIAAKQAAPHLMAGALYFDMNSVAPDTKRAAALAVEAAGGRYVDVAVMAPVEPGRRTVPLLISGPHAGDGAGVLAETGIKPRFPGEKWWAWQGLNLRPLRCQHSALPLSYTPTRSG